MSKAPRKSDATATKPAPRRRAGRDPSRNAKDPVERSEKYVANTAHGQRIGEGKARMARLHELFGQKTESMMQVMADIAENSTVHPSVRLEAADRFLNRLLGKPKEHVEHSDAADGAAANDEVMALLGNIFEAVGLPPLLEDKSSPTSDQAEGSPTSDQAEGSPTS